MHRSVKAILTRLAADPNIDPAFLRGASALLGEPVTKPVTPHPMDPDPSRPGIFRDHNCYRCRDGAKPCVNGNPRQCEFPHARND
jgi:hypothetical protein